MATDLNIHHSQPKPESRLAELDVLRGIAAIAVVYCHFISQCHELGRLPIEFRWGSYGPHLFFMISGFVIFMTLKSCKRPMDFIFSRFSRLYPLYWLGVIFSTVVILKSSSAGGEITVTQFLANLTMLQTWLRIPDIEVAYWTLGVELKFYVLMFAVLVLRKSALIEYLCGGWLLTVLGYRVAQQFVSLPSILATPLILDYAHLFIAGIMFYRLQKEGQSWLRHTLIGAVLPMAYLAEGTEVALFSAGFVGVFYLFIYGKLKWIAVRPLQWLGAISYSLYLVHGSLGHTIIDTLNEQHMPVLVLLTLPCIICLAVSALFTYCYEQPVLKWLRAWYKGKSAQSSATVGSLVVAPSRDGAR